MICLVGIRVSSGGGPEGVLVGYITAQEGGGACGITAHHKPIKTIIEFT